MILRAVNRNGVDKDDLGILTGGDALYGGDLMGKTLPMFGADPDLQALTSDEEVIHYGPKRIGAWLKVRFAQRRLDMQSHTMSDSVRTLTGRMSVFRARHMRSLRFNRTIEADHLYHWLWGRFRFLSGDGKTTWYHMLTCDAKMTFLPGAKVHTVEGIRGTGRSA